MRTRIMSMLIAGLVLAATVSADSTTLPCQYPESSQFDFWLGTWDLTWEGGTGTNVITRELGGCVIEENFTTGGERPFIGNSVSVYNARTGLWHQTWVDNSGGYLDFTGSFDNDRMVLSRTAVDTSGAEFLQRMVWFNITEDAFDWHWEKSTDHGASWETLWAIQYHRAKP